MTEEFGLSYPSSLRKRRITFRPAGQLPVQEDASRRLDVARLAEVSYTSEAPGQPIDFLFDGSIGPGGSRWVAAETDTPQRIELAFNAPVEITRVVLEAAETAAERTQQVCLQASRNGGRTFEELRRQEYNFSPGGATFEREDWAINLTGVTHLRLDVVPNQQGHGAASLVSLRLYR